MQLLVWLMYKRCLIISKEKTKRFLELFVPCLMTAALYHTVPSNNPCMLCSLEFRNLPATSGSFKRCLNFSCFSPTDDVLFAVNSRSRAKVQGFTINPKTGTIISSWRPSGKVGMNPSKSALTLSENKPTVLDYVFLQARLFQNYRTKTNF